MTPTPYIRQVHFYETDQMGIVHHSNYIHWFEEARVDYMEQAGFGYTRAIAAGVDIAVLGIACDYKSMVRYGETVRINLRIAGIAPMKMTIGYTVTDADTGVLRATGESQHCCYHRQKQRPVSFLKELPAFYEILSAIKTE